MRILLFSFLLLFSFSTLADSPITSIDIHEAYSDHEMVKIAGNSEGVITKEIIKFLYKKRKPIDVKMAIINKLSWESGGKNNSKKFWEYLKSKRKYKNTDDFLKNGRAHELLCMAYLKAMDDYFNVDEAIEIAQIAKEKNNDSFTYHMIHAIIVAQKKMNYNRCEVYSIPNEVRENSNLDVDMNEASIALIFDYVGLYEKYC